MLKTNIANQDKRLRDVGHKLTTLNDEHRRKMEESTKRYKRRRKELLEKKKAELFQGRDELFREEKETEKLADEEHKQEVGCLSETRRQLEKGVATIQARLNDGQQRKNELMKKLLEM